MAEERPDPTLVHRDSSDLVRTVDLAYRIALREQRPGAGTPDLNEKSPLI